MKIVSAIAKHKKELFTCYYPNYYAEWIVNFRTVFGTRKEKTLTLGDGITNRFNIIDQLPACETISVNDEEVINFEVNKNEFYDSCYASLKKYYVHKRRSFRIPEIKCLGVSAVFIPYQVESRNKPFRYKTERLLFEPSTNSYDKLKKHHIIQNFYLEKTL